MCIAPLILRSFDLAIYPYKKKLIVWDRKGIVSLRNDHNNWYWQSLDDQGFILYLPFTNNMQSHGDKVFDICDHHASILVLWLAGMTSSITNGQACPSSTTLPTAMARRSCEQRMAKETSQSSIRSSQWWHAQLDSLCNRTVVQVLWTLKNQEVYRSNWIADECEEFMLHVTSIIDDLT